MLRPDVATSCVGPFGWVVVGKKGGAASGLPPVRKTPGLPERRLLRLGRGRPTEPPGLEVVDEAGV